MAGDTVLLSAREKQHHSSYGTSTYSGSQKLGQLLLKHQAKNSIASKDV
jgi:hypothetical protein